MAEVVSERDAADVHAQMQGKLCSMLYAVKDETLLQQLDYVICVVHVAPACDKTEKFTQAVTQCASLYCGSDDAPLYILHIAADSNQLDISFADTTHAHALVERIEQHGISPFLRACAQSFTQPHCNVAYLYYDTVKELEELKHTVVLGHNIPLPLPVPEHAQLNSFLALCSKQN